MTYVVGKLARVPTAIKYMMCLCNKSVGLVVYTLAKMELKPMFLVMQTSFPVCCHHLRNIWSQGFLWQRSSKMKIEKGWQKLCKNFFSIFLGAASLSKWLRCHAGRSLKRAQARVVEETQKTCTRNKAFGVIANNSSFGNKWFANLARKTHFCIFIVHFLYNLSGNGSVTWRSNPWQLAAEKWATVHLPEDCVSHFVSNWLFFCFAWWLVVVFPHTWA